VENHISGPMPDALYPDQYDGLWLGAGMLRRNQVKLVLGDSPHRTRRGSFHRTHRRVPQPP
jgi:hypothetical protein